MNPNAAAAQQQARPASSEVPDFIPQIKAFWTNIGIFTKTIVLSNTLIFLIQLAYYYNKTNNSSSNGKDWGCCLSPVVFG